MFTPRCGLRTELQEIHRDVDTTLACYRIALINLTDVTDDNGAVQLWVDTALHSCDGSKQKKLQADTQTTK